MADLILQTSNLTKRFKRKGEPDVVAVENVSIMVKPGECVGLIGGSGSGKSTVARMVTRLTDPTEGTIMLNGHDVTTARGAELRAMAKDVQMVFQNPVSSFDPRHSLGDGIIEGLVNFGMEKAGARDLAADLLEQCGLPRDFVNRYPREVSGGQCQRAAIARALALHPPLVICDEATSALDVTVQEQIVGLLRDIQREHGTAYLFICHDLALAQGFCDRVYVMETGHVVEEGYTDDVLTRPQHDYTRKLLEATSIVG